MHERTGLHTWSSVGKVGAVRPKTARLPIHLSDRYLANVFFQQRIEDSVGGPAMVASIHPRLVNVLKFLVAVLRIAEIVSLLLAEYRLALWYEIAIKRCGGSESNGRSGA
jgi:hypothetical protein